MLDHLYVSEKLRELQAERLVRELERQLAVSRRDRRRPARSLASGLRSLVTRRRPQSARPLTEKSPAVAWERAENAP